MVRVRRSKNPGSWKLFAWFGTGRGMKDVELYAKVSHAVRIEGLSKRAAARLFGIDPRTVDKMMEFSVPPGYRRSKPPAKPKLGPFIAIIDGRVGTIRQGHNTICVAKF
jgi:hypothetical protein